MQFKSAVYISLILLFIGPTIQSEITYPQLTFSYDWKSKLIDSFGYWFMGTEKVNSTLENLFEQQFPILLAAWESKAPALLNKVLSVFKRGFKQKHRTAIVSLLGTGGYGSHNFLFIATRSFVLDSAPWDLNISCEDAFVDTVFHELLHIWVDENINTDSALIKYRNEESAVREHLHLMAIQKMVYIELNRFDIVEAINIYYREKTSVHYKRAWEIVNDIEGHEKIIQDIFNNLKPI